MDGQRITVIDTVGLSDTKVNFTDVQTQIEQIFDCTNVFLLVIKLGDKFTEVITAMKWIQENFQAKVLKHTIVLLLKQISCMSQLNICLEVQGSCLFVTYTIIQGIISSEM